VNYEILADNALHFPRLLESPEDYINFCRNEAGSVGVEVEPWISGGDVDPRIYGDLWVLYRSIDSDTVQKLMNNYDKAVITACEEFLNHLKVDPDLVASTIKTLIKNRPKGLTVKSYFEGERLGLHPDVDPSNTEDVLHITVSTYYNEDYIGGKLGIYGGSAIKPTPGSIVVFPSKHLHESTTVSSGIKYVSNEVIKLDSSFLKV
jgi:hypothetical protein